MQKEEILFECCCCGAEYEEDGMNDFGSHDLCDLCFEHFE